MNPAIPNREQTFANRVLATFDAPAFMKRAKGVEQAYDDLLQVLAHRRAKELAPVREAAAEVLRLGGAIAPALAALLDLPTRPATDSARRAVRVLRDRSARFNRFWLGYLADLDLSALNALRDGYNRWYVIEKECIVGNREIARAGFAPLAPLTAGDLERLFPVLPLE